ncbi:MAG: hypothetical protein ACFB21_13545 [Opitutales bacterium]
MKLQPHLLWFDWHRCRWFLVAWWALCALAAVMGGVTYWGQVELVDTLNWFYRLLPVAGAVLIGALVQPSHPARREGFFQGRPVSGLTLCCHRAALMVVALWLPFVLALSVPVLVVDPAASTLLPFVAYSICIYGTVAALLALVASLLPRGLPLYLIITVVIVVALAFVSRYKKYDRDYGMDSWWIVDNPRQAELLWGWGLGLFAGLVLAGCFLWSFCSRRRILPAALALVVTLLCSHLSTDVYFRQSPTGYGYPVADAVVDPARFTMERDRSTGYATQWNRKHGRSSGVRQMPPLEGDPDHWWFFGGKLQVQGLAPEVAFSAKVLASTWTAPDGETYAMDPPPYFYNFIQQKLRVPPPPHPTKAQLIELFGKGIAEDPTFVSEHFGRIAQANVFGGPARLYRRYRDEPGELTVRWRVDLYRHEEDLRIDLNQPGAVRRGHAEVVGLEAVHLGDEIELGLWRIVSSNTWEAALGSNWSNYFFWLIYDPVSEAALDSKGGGFGSHNAHPFVSVQRFQKDFRPHWSVPDFTEAQLQRSAVVRLQPVYLGSTEVTLTLPETPLVTKYSLERLAEEQAKTAP